MRALLDLLLPPRCPGCGREGSVLCPHCGVALRRRESEPAGAPLGLPVPLPDGLIQLEWCATFSGPIRDAVHALKYRGERRLADPLGEALARRWQAVGVGAELVAPVPVHAARRRERGFDQAEDLARACARALRLPAAMLLERQERTVAMHALGREARAGNVAGAFGLRSVGGDLARGRWVLLVDDVVTTGATLGGCAAALLAGGAVAVSAICVARES